MELKSDKVEFHKIENLATLNSLTVKSNQNLLIQFESSVSIFGQLNLKITQNQNSNLSIICVFSHSINLNIDITILGDNTISKIYNLVDLNASSKAELNQKITTQFTNNQVEHFTKIVLDDNSSASVSHITKAKSFTKNLILNQKIQALLLSPKTRVQMKPILQIESEDVSCKHGSTQGFLDTNVIYYLQSRGLNFETCKQLLTDVFKAEILDMIV